MKSINGTNADAILKELEAVSLAELMARAEAMTLAHHGPLVTYSRKVFIPLTMLCRDVCHYCTFATTPGKIGKAYLSRDEVLAIARAGVAAGAVRLCSRWGIGRKIAMTLHGPHFPNSVINPRCPMCARWPRRCCRRPDCFRISTPV